MPSFAVQTQFARYDTTVERGALARIPECLPRRSGRLFVVTTRDVWKLHGPRVEAALTGRSWTVLFFHGGEERKRLMEVERLAEEMVAAGGDRSSVVIAFGGGIVTDVAGFLAAIFLRGVPLLSAPTTLLAQVDAGVGGKTGVNLVAGKNLVGAFHQPLAVLIDPDVLETLPEREYRAGLFEVLKCGIIRSPQLFNLFEQRQSDILSKKPQIVDEMIAQSVRIKAEVVSADERESDLRRILNFGHTVGHAIEAETGYTRYLHGEAVALGMRAATFLAESIGLLPADQARRIDQCVLRYGPVPSTDGIGPAAIVSRLAADKKTVQGNVHFVLPERIGEVRIVDGVREDKVRAAIEYALRA